MPLFEPRPVFTSLHAEILELIARGMSAAKIARTLNIPLPTVNGRITRARALLGAHDRAHAVAIAIKSGLIVGPDPVEVQTVDEAEADRAGAR